MIDRASISELAAIHNATSMQTGDGRFNIFNQIKSHYTHTSPPDP